MVCPWSRYPSEISAYYGLYRQFQFSAQPFLCLVETPRASTEHPPALIGMLHGVPHSGPMISISEALAWINISVCLVYIRRKYPPSIACIGSSSSRPNLFVEWLIPPSFRGAPFRLHWNSSNPTSSLRFRPHDFHSE